MTNEVLDVQVKAKRSAILTRCAAVDLSVSSVSLCSNPVQAASVVTGRSVAGVRPMRVVWNAAALARNLCWCEGEVRLSPGEGSACGGWLMADV